MSGWIFAAWAVGIDTDSLEGQEPPPMEYWEDVDPGPVSALLRDITFALRVESIYHFHVIAMEFRSNSVVAVLVFDVNMEEKQVFAFFRCNGR